MQYPITEILSSKLAPILVAMFCYRASPNTIISLNEIDKKRHTDADAQVSMTQSQKYGDCTMYTSDFQTKLLVKNLRENQF